MDVPRQVGHEEHGALEDADQEQVAPGVVARDRLAELRHALAQGRLVDEDLARAALVDSAVAPA